MAFGKDADQKSRLGGTFTQQAAYSGRRSERQSGERSGLYWKDNFKPGQYIDTIRFIQGQYPVLEVDSSTGELRTNILPWFPFRDHFHGGLQRGGICSSGPYFNVRQKREPCLGCEIYWADWEERDRIKKERGQRPQSPNRMSTTDKFGFSIVDQGTFYKGEEVDAQGRVRTNNQNQPFYEWRKLMYANDPQAAGKQLTYGQTLAWPLNRPQFDMIQQFNELNIGQSCIGCGTYGDSMRPALQAVQFKCPQCNTVAIDLQTSTLSPLQINEIMKQPYQCHHCGTRAFLLEVLTCMTCVTRNTEPARASIFDVDLQVQMRKDSANKNVLTILAYSAPQPINAAFQHLLVPLDLPKKFAPTSLDEQARTWKVSAPGQQDQQPQGQQQQAPYQPYGQQPPPQGQQYAQHGAPPPGQFYQAPPQGAPPPQGQQYTPPPGQYPQQPLPGQNAQYAPQQQQYPQQPPPGFQYPPQGYPPPQGGNSQG